MLFDSNTREHLPTRIRATYMRGGTSKGVFFKLQDLPLAAQVPGNARDSLMLRIMGSPDPYGKQIDGMGGATSSTSKVVILSQSQHADHDVDYLFGQVSIDEPLVDWSGNCGNLTAAVGAFAITNGWVERGKVPETGWATVRIWQQNISKTIIAKIPINAGKVAETGNFKLDGVAFPGPEVQLEYVDPVAEGEAIFPTGNSIDELAIPGFGRLKTTLINTGIPTVFVNAEDIGFTGKELPKEFNNDRNALTLLESIRAEAALRMGLIKSLAEAASRQHTPKIVLVAAPAHYIAADGRSVEAEDIDLLVRAVSMGAVHHAIMGTAAVAIAAAVAIPNTVVSLVAATRAGSSLRFGHPSGTLQVRVHAECVEGQWQIKNACMSRSARVLMEGWVNFPMI